MTSKRKPSSRNTYSPVSISIAAKWDSEQRTHFSCGWTPDSQKLWIHAFMVNASCFQLLNLQYRVLQHQETHPTTSPQVVFVVPNVQIPEREERRPPRQCNWQKGEVYYWLEPGLLPHPTQWCRSESPEPKLLHKFIGWAHAVGLSRLVTSLQSNFIGQNFYTGRTFLGLSARS